MLAFNVGKMLRNLRIIYEFEWLPRIHRYDYNYSLTLDPRQAVS
jgi:hypothetical protein